ncbi:tyrosine-type recombinase/integrase [Nocardia nepalensis]|uniref:tyrosine-type recombinase/integrase n=1 Tax=Nocardia nepalensis TaxID=3375448 RepID=UPI003B66F4EE
MPTFTEYIAALRASVSATTMHSYDPYWRIVENAWGNRCLDEPTPLEIEALVETHRCQAQVRANSREGRGAVTHMISAIRCIYRHAELDNLIAPARNPASRVTKPRQLPSPRHALTREQIIAIGHVASTTGNDTELDALIIRLHIEAACRQGSLLRLELTDLEPDNCLIRLRDKGGTLRWQPISPILMTKLIAHAAARHGTSTTTRVLRYRTGRPIGPSRYTYLTARIHQYLPSAARLRVSSHWIRHTTLTYVEREYGISVARAYAGHTDNAGYQGSTPTYTKAGIVEVAEALSALTGQPHPLARTSHHPLAPWQDRSG